MPGTDTTAGLLRRYRILGAVLLACALVLLAQLVLLQLVRGREYRRRALRQSVRMLWVPALRGMIYDRALTVIADNRPAFDLDVNVRELTARARTNVARRLAVILRQPESNLWVALRGGRNLPYEPVRVASDLSHDSMTRVAEQLSDLPAVEISVNPLRRYPQRGGASHAIGYVSKVPPEHPGLRAGQYSLNDRVGASGVERVCERVLHGINGKRLVQVDRASRLVDTIEQRPAIPGQNVMLTLDLRLQAVLETTFSNRMGAAVALDPNTGEILALVSSPGFDQNVFAGVVPPQTYRALLNDPQRPLVNRAIAGQYPLGSVFKLITSIAGLEYGVLTSNTVFYDQGIFTLGSMRVRNFHRLRHGAVDIYKALRVSCNTFFCTYAVPIGVHRLVAVAQQFHLGEKTGIELPDEKPGLLPDPWWKRTHLREPWFPGDTVNLSIGHGFLLVTPLQVACMVAAIATDGAWCAPRLVRGYEINHRLVRAQPPARAEVLPFRRETLAIVKRGMWEVVNDPQGSGRLAAVPGLVVAGKTGSAQTPAQTYGWFAGFAPFHEPKLVIAVVVEQAETGGKDAAPIARAGFATYFGIDLSRHTNRVTTASFSD
jgi:penicillin-binding protein 2